MRSIVSSIAVGALYCLTIFVLLGLALHAPSADAVAGADRPAPVAGAHTPGTAG
ncbi:MAG: hypothetical protein R3199_07785 [Gemmatimonadota bacterium]|nr:hypothetical protein [Gemmatimonadota bacterium]